MEIQSQIQTKKRDKNPDHYDSFRLLIIGQTMSGKSYLATKFLLDRIKMGMFDATRVIIFAANYKTDTSIQPLIVYCMKQIQKRGLDVQEWLDNNCKESIDTEMLQQIYDNQKIIKEMGTAQLQHYCVFFDDQMSDQQLNVKRGVLSMLSQQGRHYRISQILCANQYRNTMSSTIRTQFSIVAVLRLNSNQEINDLSENFNQGLSTDYNNTESKRNWIKMYQKSADINKDRPCLIIYCYQSFGNNKYQLRDFNGPFINSLDEI